MAIAASGASFLRPLSRLFTIQDLKLVKDCREFINMRIPPFFTEFPISCMLSKLCMAWLK